MYVCWSFSAVAVLSQADSIVQYECLFPADQTTVAPCMVCLNFCRPFLVGMLLLPCPRLYMKFSVYTESAAFIRCKNSLTYGHVHVNKVNV